MKANYCRCIAIAIISLAIGFYFGSRREYDEVIRYIKGDTIIDSIPVPYPITVEIPSKPQLPMKPDTIYLDSIQIITEKVDTATIIHDYILQKTYAFNVFNNDTLGKFDVKQIIGYNKLLSFDYSFTPIHKETTILVKRRFVPFITGGYSTNSSAIIGGGIYYRNLGFEYNYNIKLDKTYYNDIDILQSNYHTLKLNYKF